MMMISMSVVLEQFKHIPGHSLLTFLLTGCTLKASCWSVEAVGGKWKGCCDVNNTRGSTCGCDSIIRKNIKYKVRRVYS